MPSDTESSGADTDLHRRAGGELSASEAAFRTFVDHATDAFLLVDHQGTILDVNRHACDALGYTRKELIGTTVRRLDAGLDERSIRSLRKRMTLGKAVTFETRHQRKDGTVFPVEVRGGKIDSGEERYLFLARDITERKRAEGRAMVQQAIARIMAEAPSVDEATPKILQALCECLACDVGVAWRMDRQANLLRCADVWRMPSVEAAQFEAASRAATFCLGSGLPGSVWASRTPLCISNVIPAPNQLRAEIAAREGLHAVMAFPILLGSQVLGVIEFVSREIRPPDQNLLDMMATIGSQIGQFVERKRAERALRENEARFRTFVDHATDAFFLLDDQLIIVDVNRQASESLGYSREQLIGMHFRNLDVGINDPAMTQLGEAIGGVEHLAAGRLGETITFETRHRRKNGSVFPVEVRGRHFQEGESRFALCVARDITDRNRAEEALRKNEARLEEAQRLASLGWWERDVQSNQVFLSDELCRIFGVSPVSLPEWHQRWIQLIHPQDRLRIDEAVSAAVRGGPRYDVEYRVIRPDGSERTVHSRGDVTWDAAGRPLRLFGVLQDITELRQAERDLRASEARFRTFVDHAMDAFFLLDDRLTIVDVNNQACKSLGYSREELVGMQVRDFGASLDDAGRERISQRVRAGETVTFETLHRRKDGTVFPVEVRAAQFEEGGRQLSLARDISERKRAEAALRESEERYRALFEKAQEAIFLTNEHDHIIEVNQRACTLLGYSRDELLTMKVPGLQAPEVRGQTGSTVVEKLKRYGNAPFETIYLHRSGRRVAVEISNTQIVDQDQNLVLSLVRDITDRKRAEKAQAELAHVTRVVTMSALTSSIAHEISQPIAATVGDAGAALRFLSAQPPNFEQAFEALNAIIANGSRAGEVVGRIRDLIKKAPPRKEDVRINDAVREVVELVKAETVKNGISVQIELGDGLPTILGDRIQLQQVMLNLIMNAIEAMSNVTDRTRELHISTDTDAAGDVLITSRDTGVGIDATNLDRIFDHFYTTKPNGLGMGLAICQSIIDAHGGRIRAFANRSYGAVFQVTLPSARDGV
jgi:PAS domain S-box-containing protein